MIESSKSGYSASLLQYQDDEDDTPTWIVVIFDEWNNAIHHTSPDTWEEKNELPNNWTYG